MQPITIIGSGLAGYTVARELRKLDKTTTLVIVTADDGRFYSKPMLSNALASGKSAESLALSDATQMQTQLNAVIHTHARVSAIDSVAHCITMNGVSLPYSKLVLALGADPMRPQLEGDAGEAVFSVNDLADYARFSAALAAAKRVAIIGGGLIGCEFANDLQAHGYQVELVHTAAYPLDRLVPPQVGQMLTDALQQIGVKWHFETTARAVDQAREGYRVTLSNGSTIAADVVLAAIGLRPRTQLANEAEIKINRGIVVDRYLQTSAADVYALGDCAEVEGLLLPYVMPLMQSARALAKTLAGEPTMVTYPVMPVVVKTPACPVVAVPPSPGLVGKWLAGEAEAGYSAVFHDVQQLVCGFALAGKAIAQKNALTQKMTSYFSAP